MASYTIDECYLKMFAEYEDVVTPREVSEMMNLPYRRVIRMIRSGELKSIKWERDYRIAKLWVIEYIRDYGFKRQESLAEQRKNKVIVYCQEPRSRKQIQEFLDLSDRKFFRDTVLNPLLEEGIIVMTIPDRPNDVRQRYVAKDKL